MSNPDSNAYHVTQLDQWRDLYKFARLLVNWLVVEGVVGLGLPMQFSSSSGSSSAIVVVLIA